jgi:hypothetical protein
MKLEEHTAVLVAIGSAAAVNCQDCLDQLRIQATTLAVSPAEMAAAIHVGLRVGRSAADKTARFAATVFEPAAPATDQSAHQVTPVPAGEHGCCVASAKEG